MKIITQIYDQVTSLENLFLSWNLFKKGKLKRKDVQLFEFNLETNIINLYNQLLNGNYNHSNYYTFKVLDPKLRIINKAKVVDRVIHQAIYSKLYEIYEPKFIHHTYSARLNKGTHKAVDALAKALRAISKNNTKEVFALKCDIRKFYDSVDHQRLIEIINRTIQDDKLINLIKKIILSFEVQEGKGLPIGNITSQIFTNIYLNELDQFIKNDLRIKYYFRYADDFIILAQDFNFLKQLKLQINIFLQDKLLVNLHPNKVKIRRCSYGIDFLGYNNLPKHKLLRTTTKKRMFKKLKQNMIVFSEDPNYKYSDYNQVMQSYLAILSHANSFKLQEKIKNQFFVQ